GDRPQLATHSSPSSVGECRLREDHQIQRKQKEEGAENQVKAPPAERTYGKNSEHCPGNRGRCEDPACPVVRFLHPAVGHRTRRGVEEHYSQRNRSHDFWLQARIENKQHRNQEESPSGSDQGSKSADSQPKQEQSKGGHQGLVLLFFS